MILFPFSQLLKGQIENTAVMKELPRYSNETSGIREKYKQEPAGEAVSDRAQEFDKHFWEGIVQTQLKLSPAQTHVL